MIFLIWDEAPENMRFYLVPEDFEHAAVVRAANGEVINRDDDVENANAINDMLCDDPEYCTVPDLAGQLLPFQVEAGDAFGEANVTFISHSGFMP